MHWHIVRERLYYQMTLQIRYRKDHFVYKLKFRILYNAFGSFLPLNALKFLPHHCTVHHSHVLMSQTKQILVHSQDILLL